MSKETQFVKWIFLFFPWLCTATTLSLYIYLNHIFDYAKYDNHPDPQFVSLYGSFGTIVFFIFLFWACSILFTLFYSLLFFTKNKSRKPWKELAVLLTGHLSYFFILKFDVLTWFID